MLSLGLLSNTSLSCHLWDGVKGCLNYLLISGILSELKCILFKALRGFRFLPLSINLLQKYPRNSHTTGLNSIVINPQTNTHTTYRKKLLRHLHCMKENVALKIGPMTSLLRCGLWRHIFYYANLQPALQPATIPAHRLNLRWSKSVDWKQAKMIRKVPQSSTRRMTVGTGRRTIGQFAGHTIHLEIEEWPG